MKTPPLILCCLALLFGASSVRASIPESADALLVSPWEYEGHTVKLNVAFVRPTHFQSPLEEVIFYHAMTLTPDRKQGGEILIAVAKKESEHFARYYGMDPHGRNSRILSGTLLLAHRPHPPFHRHPSDSNTGPDAATEPAKKHEARGVWFVDYKGMNADLFSKNKELGLPEGGGPGDNQHRPAGPAGGGRHDGPGDRAPGNRKNN